MRFTAARLPTVALAALALPAPGLAATVSIFTRAGTVSDSASGQASVSIGRADEQASGAANERPGFVGVASSTAAQSRQPDPFNQPSDLIPQVSTQAGFADLFFHRLGSSPDLGNGTYRLTFAVSLGGTSAAGQTPAPNGVPMSSSAAFTYRYSLGSLVREGSFSLSRFNGGTDIVTSGLGAGGVYFDQSIVHIGDFTTIGLNASGFSSAAAYGLGSASSSVGAEARWLGVSAVEYDAGGGNFVAAPTGFRLDLTSDSSGFDYWNAAVAPPAGGVPEPASWVLLITGFGFVGGSLRRQRYAAA
ncbi:hypothetical protein IP88_09045 [alpha proteobacterium AAP81b]|nr:hypothetical protein IP88_09045 [alpha proteobacterium AAP81b]